MIMVKLKRIGCVALVLLLLTGYAAKAMQEETQADAISLRSIKGSTQKKQIETEGWRIQTGCSKITGEMAQSVYQEVRGLKEELGDGIYTMKNSRIVFLTEETREDEVMARAVFEADYTAIRNPREHPLILGMYAAKETLTTDQERQAADEYIDGFLAEMYPEYKKTERVSLDVAVKFDVGHPNEYVLYYPLVQNSKEKLKPLKKYAGKYWKEDKKQMKRMGRKKLLENVKAEMPASTQAKLNLISG